MRKASPLQQALKDAWYAGYNAAIDRITNDTEIPALFEFDRYMERVVELLEKGEE